MSQSNLLHQQLHLFWEGAFAPQIVMLLNNQISENNHCLQLFCLALISISNSSLAVFSSHSSLLAKTDVRRMVSN